MVKNSVCTLFLNSLARSQSFSSAQLRNKLETRSRACKTTHMVLGTKYTHKVLNFSTVFGMKTFVLLSIV